MEDTEETKRCYERVLSMYNILISVKRNWDRKGFKVERLLGFHERGSQNITDYNLQPKLSSFNLLLDPTVKDGDCLFNSVLKQLSKLLFTNSNDEFSSHIVALDLLHEDKAIAMLKLRSAFCFVLFCFFRFYQMKPLLRINSLPKDDFNWILLFMYDFMDPRRLDYMRLGLWLSGFNSGKSFIIRHRNSFYWL